MKLHYLSKYGVETLKAWFDTMQSRHDQERQNSQVEFCGLGPSDRARLLRAQSIEDLETEQAVNLLVMHLLRRDWINNFARRRFDRDPAPLLMIAGVLAAVKKDREDGKSLAWRVGKASAIGGRAPMNEIRFRRLLKEQDLEDFLMLVRRAEQLAGGNVDVVVLADDLIAWAYERELPNNVQAPVQSLCFRWAQDYYTPDYNQI